MQLKHESSFKATVPTYSYVVSLFCKVSGGLQGQGNAKEIHQFNGKLYMLLQRGKLFPLLRVLCSMKDLENKMSPLGLG